MQNSFNKLSYIVTEIKEGTDICDTSKICKNKTTYLLLYKLTKAKEKSKELIKICNYLQTWWFLHSVSYIKSSRDRSKRLNSNLHAWKNK